MSYDLGLDFAPPIPLDRFKDFFAARKHYQVRDREILYENPATSVAFVIRYRASAFPGFFGKKTVKHADFEIAYYRPSVFGLEAAIELAALVAQFTPDISDPQMKGMGEGPYSDDGFLSGWNFGNVFATHAMCQRHTDGADKLSLPQATLQAAWRWNYGRDSLQKRIGDEPWVSPIRYIEIDGALALCGIWPEGRPVMLPSLADYVGIGRVVDGEPHFGLVTRHELIDVLAKTGVPIADIEGQSLTIEEHHITKPISDWFDAVPLINLADLPPDHRADTIIDREVLEAAAAFGRDQA